MDLDLARGPAVARGIQQAAQAILDATHKIAGDPTDAHLRAQRAALGQRLAWLARSGVENRGKRERLVTAAEHLVMLRIYEADRGGITTHEIAQTLREASRIKIAPADLDISLDYLAGHARAFLDRGQWRAGRPRTERYPVREPKQITMRDLYAGIGTVLETTHEVEKSPSKESLRDRIKAAEMLAGLLEADIDPPGRGESHLPTTIGEMVILALHEAGPGGLPPRDVKRILLERTGFAVDRNSLWPIATRLGDRGLIDVGRSWTVVPVSQRGEWRRHKGPTP